MVAPWSPESSSSDEVLPSHLITRGESTEAACARRLLWLEALCQERGVAVSSLRLADRASIIDLVEVADEQHAVVAVEPSVGSSSYDHAGDYLAAPHPLSHAISSDEPRLETTALSPPLQLLPLAMECGPDADEAPRSFPSCSSVVSSFEAMRDIESVGSSSTANGGGGSGGSGGKMPKARTHTVHSRSTDDRLTAPELMPSPSSAKVATELVTILARTKNGQQVAKGRQALIDAIHSAAFLTVDYDGARRTLLLLQSGKNSERQLSYVGACPISLSRNDTAKLVGMLRTNLKAHKTFLLRL